MKTKQILGVAALAMAMSLGASSVLAQNNDNNNNNGQGRKRGGNFDPAQFQQQMMDRTKERLEITDDTEWNAIKPLVQKVIDARMASFRGGFGGFRGRNRGGGGGTDNGGAASEQSRRAGHCGGAPPPGAEAFKKAD